MICTRQSGVLHVICTWQSGVLHVICTRQSGVLHVICTRMQPGHLSDHVGDSSRRSEEIVKILEFSISVQLLLSLLFLHQWMIQKWNTCDFSCQNEQLSCPSASHDTQHAARDQPLMCCAWFSPDCTLPHADSRYIVTRWDSKFETSISVWPGFKWWKQICPWDTLPCCYTVSKTQLPILTTTPTLLIPPPPPPPYTSVPSTLFSSQGTELSQTPPTPLPAHMSHLPSPLLFPNPPPSPSVSIPSPLPYSVITELN